MAELPTISPIKDRIWITSRVRMTSERKLLRRNRWSLFILTYYSVLTVVLSIFADYYSAHFALFPQISLASSVVVLVASIVVSGYRFEIRAAIFRNCYLELQLLQSQKMPDEEMEESYAKLLDRYPNHHDSDYYDFLISSKYLDKSEVYRGGKPIPITFWAMIFFLSRKLVFITFSMLAVSAPLAFFIAPIWPDK